MDQSENRFYREALGQSNDGGPAFPVNDQTYAHRIGAAAIDGLTDTAERDRLYIAAATRAVAGMSLRDYFAAKAMAGICSHENTWGCGIEEIGARAYEIADHMIKARAS